MAGVPRGAPKTPVSPEAKRVGEILRQRRLSEKVNKTQEDIALEAGIAQKTLSQVELGHTDFMRSGFDNVIGILKALKWTFAEFQQATGVELDLGVARAVPLTVAEPTPVYSLAALATAHPKPDGVNATPHPGKHPAHWLQTFMVGDEMEPRIPDGFSIYLDTDKTTPDTGIYIIRTGERAFPRRYSTLPSGPAWTADNPAYALSFIPATPDVQVLGKVYRIVGVREAVSLLN